MGNLPVRPSSKKSTLSIIDDGLLVVAVVVGALIALKLFGAIVATAWFLVKLALFVGLVFVVVRAIRNRGR